MIKIREKITFYDFISNKYYRREFEKTISSTDKTKNLNNSFHACCFNSEENKEYNKLIKDQEINTVNVHYKSLINSIKNFKNNFIRIGIFYLSDAGNSGKKIYFEIYFRKVNLSIQNKIEEYFFYDITDLMNYKHQLIELQNKKKKISMKIAHDFKTPLNSIIGIINSIKLTETRISSFNLKRLDTITNLSNYVIFLISDIIQYSNINENCELNFNITKLNLKEILNFCYQILLGLLTCNRNKNENIAPQLIIEDNIDRYNIRGDEIRLKQIILNFISNAVKYTNEGTITLKSKKVFIDDRKYLKISVKDTGMGITEENQLLLFNQHNIYTASKEEFINKKFYHTTNVNNTTASNINTYNINFSNEKNLKVIMNRKAFTSAYNPCRNPNIDGNSNVHNPCKSLHSVSRQSASFIFNAFNKSLGMSITNFFIQKMNYKLRFKSEYLKGSTFSVLIPIFQHNSNLVTNKNSLIKLEEINMELKPLADVSFDFVPSIKHQSEFPHSFYKSSINNINYNNIINNNNNYFGNDIANVNINNKNKQINGSYPNMQNLVSKSENTIPLQEYNKKGNFNNNNDNNSRELKGLSLKDYQLISWNTKRSSERNQTNDSFGSLKIKKIKANIHNNNFHKQLVNNYSDSNIRQFIKTNLSLKDLTKVNFQLVFF